MAPRPVHPAPGLLPGPPPTGGVGRPLAAAAATAVVLVLAAACGQAAPSGTGTPPSSEAAPSAAAPSEVPSSSEVPSPGVSAAGTGLGSSPAPRVSTSPRPPDGATHTDPTPSRPGPGATPQPPAPGTVTTLLGSWRRTGSTNVDATVTFTASTVSLVVPCAVVSGPWTARGDGGPAGTTGSLRVRLGRLAQNCPTLRAIDPHASWLEGATAYRRTNDRLTLLDPAGRPTAELVAVSADRTPPG